VKYLIDFMRGDVRVDQLLVLSDEAFDEQRELAAHRRWHPGWPDGLRPNSAILIEFQDFKS
jgi:hypothetical protein